MFMAKKKNFTLPFAAALDHYLRITGTTQKEIAYKIGYTNRNMISAIIHERTKGEENKRREVAKHFGVKYDDFLFVGERLINGDIDINIPAPQMTGQAHHTPPQPCPECANIHNEFLSKHFEVVKEFQDREWALKANQTLVKLEKMAPEQKEMAIKLLNILISDEKKTLPKKTG